MHLDPEVYFRDYSILKEKKQAETKTANIDPKVENLLKRKLCQDVFPPVKVHSAAVRHLPSSEPGWNMKRNKG
ncbi:hypothetical protein DGMP_10060 [Desulfomarina profundi]|uniref:Uncharacterized protein n=1 Tax=Desulfomarina profundi TaxID=2772557 RepID=A0A8D5FFE1_9BACT|nr:hypothetical protein DGMP_10060 [Desulfomarina profundi]